MLKTPSRNRFQFHLSTALALTCVAGLLVGANFGQRKHFTELDSGNFSTDDAAIIQRRLENTLAATRNYNAPVAIKKDYGWPFCFLKTEARIGVNSVEMLKNARLNTRYFSAGRAFFDLAIALIALFGEWIISERFISRRSASENA